jgi:undecaprenyl-diphosphatase
MVRRIILNVLEWLGRHEPVVLLGVLVVVAGTWGFITLADVMLDGQTQRFDEWSLRCLRRPDNPTLLVGPEWMGETARDLTALGGVAVLTSVTIAVAGFLLLNRKFAAMGFVLTAVLGGLAISCLLKAGFARPRPQLVPHLCQVYDSSFPSGHSMMSAVVYLTLGALLSELIALRRLKFYLLALALLLAGLVGVSRVYLGVHYPTDVLGGWAAGLVWAVFCWLLARTLRRHGLLENPPSRPRRHAMPIYPGRPGGAVQEAAVRMAAQASPEAASTRGPFL